MAAQAAIAANMEPGSTKRAPGPARRPSPVAVAVVLSVAIHAGAGLYFITARFVSPPEPALTEEAVLVEMFLPQVQPEKPAAPAPPPPTPQPPAASPVKTRTFETPVPSDMAPLAMAAVEAPKTVAAPASVAAAPSPAEEKDSFTGVDVDMALTQNPAPAYPPKSVMLREQGTVWLRLQVRADGSVGEVQLKTSSGFARLDGAARHTVRHWKFAPARRNGQAVDTWVNVPIRFNLKSSS